MEKRLILKDDSNDFEKFFIDKMIRKDVDVYPVYKHFRHKLPYIIRVNHFFRFKFIPYKSFWYENWKSTINNYDVIIIFDYLMGIEIIEYIREKNKKCRLIYWCWNKIEKNPEEIKKSECEIWSFDKSDCKKYHLNYNNQFYFNELDNKEYEDIYDAVFIGKNKKRVKLLEEIKKHIGNNDKVKFLIKPDSNELIDDSMILHENISYEDVVNLIKHSKCIVDIVKSGQEGLTLRVMESIFYKKKLITNNIEILNYDLYLKDNIFIVGIDKWERLEEFINSKYVELKKEILEKYTYEKWLNNFGIAR